MEGATRFFAIASVVLACDCSGGNDGPSPMGMPDATAVPGPDATAPAEGGTMVPIVGLTGAVFGPTIDDMSQPQSPAGGSWYTYSSRSLPNSEPPILTTDAGTLVPLEGASFPPSTGTSVPPLVLDGGTLGVREFRGGGIPSWGAGFGMDLVSAVPDGGPVAVNACDAGILFDTSPEAGAVGIPQPVDASAYTGFAFWGISLEAADLKIEVHLDDADTTPWGGAFCDPCRSSGKCTPVPGDAAAMDCPCSDNFYEVVTLPHGQWKQFAIRWKDSTFQANHWSGEGPLTFDATRVYNIHFQVTIGSGTTPPFDIAVANLEWLTN